MSAEPFQQDPPRAESHAERSPGVSQVAIVFFGISATVLTLLVWLWPQSDPITPLGCLFVALVLFAVHLAVCGRRLGAFDLALWIPVLMILHYFGMPVAVELIPDTPYYTYDTYGHGLPRVAQGFALALSVLALFLFGFHLLPTLDRNSPPDPLKRPDSVVAVSALILMLGGVGMMAIGVPLVGPGVIFGAYGEMKEAEKFGLSDFRLIGAGFLFAAAGTYGVIATSRRLNSPRFRLAAGCAAFVLAFLLLSGDRSGMAVAIFAGGWALTQSVVRIPRWVTVVGFSFMFLVMPVIKEYREYRSIEQTRSASVKNLAAATFYEMGSSVQVYSYTIDRIPSEKSFSYGTSVVVQIINIIPNVWGAAGARYLRFDPLVYDPSKWVTWAASPTKYYTAGGGYGFAVGAEWYFNFGYPGVYFGMIGMGCLAAFLRNRSRTSTMWLIGACLYFGLLAGAVRNDLGYPARTVLWPLTGYLILNFVVRAMRPQGQQSVPVASSSGFEGGARGPGEAFDRPRG